MTSRRLLLTFKIILFYFLTIVALKADLIIPNSSIKPKEVIQIQLTGLMKNDNHFKDSGIEQTWNFAHPENKKNTHINNKFFNIFNLKGRSVARCPGPRYLINKVN